MSREYNPLVKTLYIIYKDRNSNPILQLIHLKNSTIGGQIKKEQ
jgi:hypothetical protein